jgi:hypothetical protein
MAEQIQTSKGNTQAYANVVSAVNGENQSDSNSTSNKVAKAFAEVDSKTETYQATKSLGTSASNDLLNSAWQNHFKGDRFKNYTPEQKTDYAVNEMERWSQSADGIKDSMNFIKDNTNSPELKNPINNSSKIDNGEKYLGEKTENVGTITYDPGSNSGTKTNIEAKGKEIENTPVGTGEVKKEVESHVKPKGEVIKEVNEKFDDKKNTTFKNGKLEAQEWVDNSTGLRVAKTLDSGNPSDLYKGTDLEGFMNSQIFKDDKKDDKEKPINYMH